MNEPPPTATAAAQREVPAQTADSVQVHTLDNGLQVCIQEDHQIPLVAVALQYGVGSRDEEPGASGRAHLFEHLMFQGTHRVGPSAFLQRVLDVGGTANASTSSAATRYHCTLPSHHALLGLWLEADRMEGLAVTEQSFRTQLAAVIEERRERVDNAPYGRPMELLQQNSFAQWAQSHPIIGEMVDLENADYQGVLGFHQRWYRPDNAALAIVGDIEPARALDAVDRWFGGIPAGGLAARPSLDEPPRSAPVEWTEHDPLARLPAVFSNHQAPAVTHPLAPALDVLEAVLLRGAASRLQRRLVIESPLAVQLGGGFDRRSAPGTFGVGAILHQGIDPQAILDQFQAELQRLRDHPIDDDELLRSRQPLLAGHLFARESPLSRAMGQADGIVQYGRWDWSERYLTAIQAVTPAEVSAAAALVLASPAVTLHVQPGGPS